MARVSSAIRVLHVDDEPDFADLATTFLEREDDRFNTETATSANEGLDRLSGRTYDCIVSDYDMPGESGIEFLETVRDEYPDIPFILFTGKGSEEVASDAISAGVTDYLQKKTESEQYTLLANRIKNAVERREAERERNRQLEAIETAQEGISILGEDEQYIYVNQRFADLHGYDSEELIGKHWELVYPDDDIPEVREDILPEVEQEGYWHGETTSLRADGNTVPVDHTLASTDRGELVCTVRDITDQKQRKRELERYERIVGNLPVGVFRTTPDGDFVDTNEQYLSLLGAKSQSAVADSKAQDFWADPDDREELLSQLGKKGVVENQEVKIETLNGESKWVETIIQITYENGDQYLDGIAYDVTERRERQQRLEQAETMFENAQDSLFLIDVSEEFTVERVNPAYEETTGLTNDALSGRTPRDILGDDQGAEIEQKYRECVEDRVELEYEETLSIDGHQTHWETRIAPVLIDDEVQKIVGATRNITGRKKREQKLQLVETLFENAEECQFIVDVADGEFELRHANEYYKRTVGLPPNEPVTGQTPTVLFGETGGQEILDRYRECVETRESVTYTVEVPVPEEGTVYRTILTPVITDDEVTHIVGTARDVTELREREQELREERAFIEQSLDALEDVFYVFSADREILRWNDHLSEVTGYPDEEITGMEPTDFFPENHQPRIADAITEIIETGNTTVQADFLTTDGERIPHEFTGFRLTDPDGEGLGFAGIGRDLRRQREYERQLEQRNERLEEFTSIVSHDLRNPLTMADGRLELAREECESEHLGEVQRALDRMDALIEDLLNLAREGETVTDLEPIDLTAIIEGCWTNVDTKDATLVTDIDQIIHADESRLKQVFENIVRNAVEHGGEEVTVTVGELDDGFYVEDDGPGIPEDERDDVFDAGYTTTEEGTGFGLSIVKQVVDAHDWEIHVTEGTDGGARFEIIDLKFK